MPLLLEHCGFSLRSAAITIGFLALFAAALRVAYESADIAALKSVEDDDFPKDAKVSKRFIPVLLGFLYTRVSAACAMILSSGLMLFGVYKSIPNFAFLWIVMACVYVIIDLSVNIFIGVTYYDVNDFSLTITLDSLADAVYIYFIMVVGAYFKSLTGRFIPSFGSGYQNLDE